MTPTYLDHLDAIAAEDAAGLKKAQQSYGDSWKKRGGVGAFMMLARKWDRIEKALDPTKEPGDQREAPMSVRGTPVPAFDIFAGIAADTRAEGLIDDIRDLRRYLMLVEAEARATGAVSATTTHRDNAKPVPLSVLKALRSFVNLRVGCDGENPEMFHPSDKKNPEERAACDALVEAGVMEYWSGSGMGRAGYVFKKEES